MSITVESQPTLIADRPQTRQEMACTSFQLMRGCAACPNKAGLPATLDQDKKPCPLPDKYAEHSAAIDERQDLTAAQKVHHREMAAGECCAYCEMYRAAIKLPSRDAEFYTE